MSAYSEHLKAEKSLYWNVVRLFCQNTSSGKMIYLCIWLRADDIYQKPQNFLFVRTSLFFF